MTCFGVHMSNTTKAVLIITLGTLLSKIAGFSREIALAYKYGASSISDIYLIASTIPANLFNAVALAVSICYVPIISSINDSKKISQITSNLLNILGIVSVVLAIIFIVYCELIVRVFAIGLEADSLQLTTQLTQIMLPLLIFLIPNSIFLRYLNVNHKFFAPSIIAIPLNVMLIAGILLSSTHATWIMGVGTLLAYVAVFFFLLFFAYKAGFEYKLIIDLHDPYLKKLLYLTLPIFIGASVDQINAIIGRSFGSTLGEGVISALNYSSRLMYFINGMIVTSIVTALFPRLSRLSALHEMKQFKQILTTSITTILLIVIPISIGTVILAKPVVSILFERGAFNAHAAILTSDALVCYAIGILALGIRELLSKVFYSIQDTRTPMINGALAVILNIIMMLVFVRYVGYIGIPLATSISSILMVVLLGYHLRKKIGPFGLRNLIQIAVKICIASLGMGLVVWSVYICTKSIFPIEKTGDFIGVILAACAGMAAYLVAVKLLRVKEIDIVFNIIRKRQKQELG